MARPKKEKLTEQVENPEEILGKPWRKFLEKLRQPRPDKVHEWEALHLLSYNLQKFKETYNIDYTLSLTGAPSKSAEIVFTKKLFALLNSNNPSLVKQYIDWAWDLKISARKMKIKSLSFFTTPGFINEFKFYIAEKNKITKSTPLPNDYATIISDLNVPVSTFGDVLLVKTILDENQDDPTYTLYKEVMTRLYSIGFEDTVLKSL